MDSIEIPAPPDTCPLCDAEYENIGHPMKPGVIMMRTCKCEITVQETPYGIITVFSPPGAPSDD